MLESIIVPLILIAITYTATVWLQQHHSRKKATESETTVETRDYEGEIKKLNEEKLELEKKLSQREKKFEKVCCSRERQLECSNRSQNSVEFSVYREEKEQNEKLNETVQQRLKKQIAAFELQTKQQSKEVEKLRSLLEEKNGELNRMRDQLQQTEVELKQARRAVNEQQKEQTSRIKQHDTTIDNLKKQIALNEKQVKKAIQQQKEYDEMNNHIVYLENQLKVKDQDIEMDKQTIQELRHEIDSYETKFGPESDNSYVSEEIDELKTQVENLQNSVLQMKDDIRLKEERVVALEEEVKSRDIEIEKGNQLLNELRSSYEQQMSEMEDRLTAVPEDRNTINNLVQLHNEELSELRSRMQLAIDQEKEKLEQIAEELFFKDQHIKEYKDIVEQFKTEIENERKARSEMKNKMDDDIEQLKHLYTDKIDQLQHEKSVLESNIMKHVNHLEFRNTELLRKLDEIDSARIKERYEIEKERRDIEDEREKLFTDRTSKINELQKRISQEETDHKKANAYAEYLHKALKQKNEEISDLRQQVHKLLNASKSGTNTPRNVQTIDSGYANSKVLEEIMLRPQINIPPATNAISPRVAAKQEEQHSINDHKKISTV